MYYGYPGYMYDTRYIQQLYRNPYPNGAYGMGYHQPGYIWYPNQSIQRFETSVPYRNDLSALRQLDASDPFSVIREQIQAQSKNDWETVTKLWVDEDKKAFEAIVEQESRQNGEGMLAIENAEIVASKPLSEQLASAIGNYDQYKDKYGEAQTYYVAVKYKVKEDSEFLQNGINYLVATVVKESGQWKMASYSIAPVDIVSDSGEGFNTVDEGIAIATQKRREFGGMIVNKEGALLSINTTKEYLPELEKLIGQPSLEESPVIGTLKQFIRTPPSTIKVLVKNRKNGRVGSVLTLSFYEYIRHVLPNEWDLRSLPHALKAGALCAIMYSWYFVRKPGFPLAGAHVSDSTDYQAWLKNTPVEKTKITDPHVKNVFQEIRIGMYNQKDNSLFPTQYRSDGYNIDWQKSGIVSQAGTNRLAKQGKHFTQILEWYYSNSSKLRGGKLGFFNY